MRRTLIAAGLVWLLSFGHWSTHVINGALYPVVASVSASHSIIEIGPERKVEIGDTVTCFDWQEGSRPEDVADSSKSSVYDLTMHLNPLLPRRVV